jgi:uncharacterized membrane protein YbhN (UPF0104 family)
MVGTASRAAAVAIEPAARPVAPLRSNRKPGLTARPWWPALKRTVTVAFLALVLYLIVTQARAIDWSEVLGAMRGTTPLTLAIAAGLAACSYAVYASFDLLGRHYTGHALRVPQVLGVTLICYAINLNLGSLVGGVALRYRLYSRLGLDTAVITRVLGLSLVTNWLGYLMLAGLVFALRPLELPPGWAFGSTGLRALGLVLLALALGYLALCAFARRRSLHWREHEFVLPPLRLALLQLAVSSLNWLLIAGVVYVLLQQKIAYPTVLAVLLVGAVAGVITHVPAGLGVLEAVFIALLSSQLPQHQLLAALLAYRAIYYLAPLMLASLLYFVIESRAKKAGLVGVSSAPTG